MDDADGDLDAGGDGADGFPALAAGEDGGAFVVVDHGSAAADPAAAAGRLQAVLGLADDVAALVLGQGQGQIENQGALGVLAGRDALQALGARCRWELSAASGRLRSVSPVGAGSGSLAVSARNDWSR